ncbi:hypothetical protein LTR64_007941 [Lithohypha guttulata]|uniref:uncharacterized protein n=1 Tax=Lithohypha guttulata TaxID=1690604 RepID=UPI00315C9A88
MSSAQPDRTSSCTTEPVSAQNQTPTNYQFEYLFAIHDELINLLSACKTRTEREISYFVAAITIVLDTKDFYIQMPIRAMIDKVYARSHDLTLEEVTFLIDQYEKVVVAFQSFNDDPIVRGALGIVQAWK